MRDRAKPVDHGEVWLEKLTAYLNHFIHFTPDGLKDMEANEADPVAMHALRVLASAEDLIHPPPVLPPPLDAADTDRIR